jgi:hypothetical protein
MNRYLPLKIYSSLEEQIRFSLIDTNNCNAEYIIVSKDRFPNFQLQRPTNKIFSPKLSTYCLDEILLNDFTDSCLETDCTLKTINGYDYISFKQDTCTFTLTEGKQYFIFEDGISSFYSEVFIVKNIEDTESFYRISSPTDRRSINAIDLRLWTNL